MQQRQVTIAKKTLAAIDRAIERDQGASFRGWLGKVIPHMDDAYREDNFPFRNHMGASGIGDNCARKIFYGFRWTTVPTHPGRLLRLFNRGHLEEARFLAMLLAIGCQVYNQDENGKQFAISGAGGHFGGSGDGVIVGCPDLPADTAALLEFKTASYKAYNKMKAEGVQKAKPVYYVQMQVYMRKMGLSAALFMVVNKNDDELYAEIVLFDPEVADRFIDRGERLVFFRQAPEKISESPSWYECKMCDHIRVCHLRESPAATCRSCGYSDVVADGTWVCMAPASEKFDTVLSKHQQLEGCDKYKRLF